MSAFPRTYFSRRKRLASHACLKTRKGADMRTKPAKPHLPTIAAVLLLACGFILLGLTASPEAMAQEDTQENAQENTGQIDYAGFQALTAEAAPHRAARLVPLETFNTMRADPDTLIIDARSAQAFALGHIEGAVNLNFSDFTEEKLAAVIGPKDRRILIYCNNNFTDDVAPVPLKSAPLALNIATYVNLYGYGYRNLYELDGAYGLSDERVVWAGNEG
ncbi:rhodanese-like domain protein [Hyphomonas neptunium ATCC 15444]|uniref:Rhodanese-like domain protein n=2 Tax=Hyphomonas TaxID=85 RepID=Q0BXG8_HYPNA|nr:rhodanese-like domain protein [Hyphomonas neptunium ATCC 15444]